MKITLPENQSEITLATCQEYEVIVNSNDSIKVKEDKVISLFTGIELDNIGGISQKDREDILDTIHKAIDEEHLFTPTFFVDGVEFGMIPNFDKDEIDGDEYTDMSKYGDKGWEQMHLLMSVLFRPIKNRDKFGNYNIGLYNGTSEHREQIKKMPLSIVKAAIGFFLTLRKELLDHILVYSEEVQQKEAHR